jgi:hypothetical protein
MPRIPCPCLLLLLLFGGCAADSDERILDFHADIEVQADGSLLVAERIRVKVTGQDIKRGIVRVFPTLYRGRFMERVPTGFEVLEVQRDGRREPNRIERGFYGVEMYIGSSSVFLDPGEYTYTIRYRSTHQVLHFDGHDELYWNVTGNDWAFPIDRASAEVRLPTPTAPLDVSVYTGARGWTGSAADVEQPQPGRVRFATTQPLGRGHGMTVVVAMPKGLVVAPSTAQARAFLWAHNGSLIVGLIGLVVVGLYYLLAWLLVGRDPPGGVVMPRYEPLAGQSPGAARYLANMAFDDSCVVADLVDAGVQGRLKLKEEGMGFSIESVDPAVALPSWQAALVDALIPNPGDRLSFGPAQRDRVQKAQEGYEAALKAHFRPDYFVVNRSWWGVGAVLSLLVLLACMVVPPYFDPFSLVIGSLWILVWGAFALGLFGAGAWMVLSGHPFIGLAMVAGSVMPGVALWLGTSEFMRPEVGLEGVLLVGLLGAAAVGFGFLLKRPTPHGRAEMDRIAGLKLYLGMAEKTGLAGLSGPEPDDERYQQLLPWAMALDVEAAWTRRFSLAVGEADASRAQGQMRWISSRGAAAAGGATLGAAIGRSLGNAISSSRPGSSSGRSGGGRSGGGRGGGGGRGW